MADIKISNLSGNDLFSDSESFMSNLSEEELTVQGGLTPALVIGAILLLWPNKAY